MTKYRKVINPNKSKKGVLRTPKQIETSRLNGIKTMLTKNPMKKPEIAIKQHAKLKGRKKPELTLRNIKNNPSKTKPPFKGKKHTQETKNKIGVKNCGRRIWSEEQKKELRKRFLLNNPMKNSQIAKKQHLNDNRNKKFKRRCNNEKL